MRKIYSYVLFFQAKGRRGRPPKASSEKASSVKVKLEPKERAERRRLAKIARANRPKKPTNKLKFTIKEENKKFYCTFAECEQSEVAFANKESIELHFNETHVKDNNKIIPCYICEEKFALTFQRNNHMEAAHERGFGCAKCDKK